MSKVRILVVDDEKLIRKSLAAFLARQGYAVRTAPDLESAYRMAAEAPPDVVLLDVDLPFRRGEPPGDAGGLDAIERFKEVDPGDAPLGLQVIMLTAADDSQTVVEAFKRGADDYIVKPYEVQDVESTIRKSVEAVRRARLGGEGRPEGLERRGASRIRGESEQVRKLLDLISKIAVSDASTVLLTGESGTGKDLVARAIHYESPRCDRPFMAINCTAIAETLLESELMGHEKGAFTDARSRKLGLIELADGGTVFLDEIGDMRPSLQVKLLRTLEEKVVRRVGGTEVIPVDIRIVAATNRDLVQAVRAGEFREDLYYRLKVFPIHLPPLRDRPGDIPVLASVFRESFNAQYDRAVEGFTDEAMEILSRHPWPGNVRELKNLVERAIILKTGGLIDVGDLPSDLTPEPASGAGVGNGAFELPPDGVSLEEVERDLIRQALERTNHNQTRAAKMLHLTRDALRYRMKKFELR